MYSLLSQKKKKKQKETKNKLNYALISKWHNSSQNFLRCSSWVIILIFDSNKIFHFFLRLTNFSLTIQFLYSLSHLHLGY